MAEQEAIGLLEQLARDFNVRDPRKLFQIARREFPDRRDLTSARAAAALRGDVARQVLAPKPRSLGKSAAEGPNDRLQADLVGLQPEHERAEQVRLGGPRRLHPGDCHEGPARQAGGNGDAGGRGDHPGPGPGGGQLRRYHGIWATSSRPRGGAARRGGAPAKGPHGPQCNGGRR